MTGQASAVGAVTENMVETLRGTKGWVLLVGILMFIGAGFMVVAGVGMVFGGAMAQREGAPPFAVFGVVYIAMALLYIFPGLFLVRYSSAVKRLLAGGQANDMEAALEQQRKFWKFCGIMAIVGMVLFFIGIIAAIAIPLMMRH